MAEQFLDVAKFVPSTAGTASVNIAPGVAPATPNNGDLWMTAGGLFTRVAGVTQQAEVQSNKGAASGYAGLDAGSKILASAVPIATATAVGGVKQGANITIAADGTISTTAGAGVTETHVFSPNGYEKLSSGRIFQWGTTVLTAVASGTNTTISATFPTTFPNACLNIIWGFDSEAAGPLGTSVENLSQSTTGASALVYSTNAQNLALHYFATGY